MIGSWIKALARYRRNIKRAETYLAAKSSIPSVPLRGRPVVLDLRTPQLLFDSGRHPVCIAMNARLAGSPTYLRCSRLLLGEFARKQFGQTLLTDAAVTWLSPQESIPVGSLVLSDTASKPRGLDVGSACVEMMIGRDIVDRAPVMPYPMHPMTLSQLASVDLRELRNRNKQIQVLFAGRLDSRYGNARIEREFAVTNRISMVDAIHRHCGDRVVTTLRDVDPKSPIALVDSRTASVAAEDWLPTLACTNFFLCCPGAAQPMCHNVVEAMSVGAIPILEYADRFVPKLIDGVNAICFRTADGLCDAIDRIERLSTEDIRRIRANVIDYYERYLRGDQFLSQLGDREVDQVCLPFNNKNFFRTRLRAANQAA